MPKAAGGMVEHAACCGFGRSIQEVVFCFVLQERATCCTAASAGVERNNPCINEPSSQT